MKSPRQGYREKEMGEYLAEKMFALGMEVESRDVLPGRPNVLGTIKGNGNGPSLMLAGHMDTARSDGYDAAYEVYEKEGMIHGRGSCDMKAAIAAYLEVARLLKESKTVLAGDLIIAGMCDEEYRMLGSQDIGRERPCCRSGNNRRTNRLEGLSS